MTLVVSSLRAEYRSDSPVVAVPRPRLSWKTVATATDWFQAAAELEWTAGGATSSVTIAGPDSHLVDWPFADLAPRARGRLRVRMTGTDGEISEWSDPLDVVAGFLGTGEWTARFIGLRSPEQVAQPMLARSTFTVEKGLVAATLYATAHGVYQAEVNGEPVDAEILKPGWTPYQWRLVHETTDITALLRAGKNAIGATTAGGWYTERYGFQGLDRPLYGEQVAFAALIVLEYDNGSRVVLETGESWRVSAAGPTLSSGIYAGESYDASLVQRGWSSADFDADGWEAAGHDRGVGHTDAAHVARRPRDRDRSGSRGDHVAERADPARLRPEPRRPPPHPGLRPRWDDDRAAPCRSAGGR